MSYPVGVNSRQIGAFLVLLSPAKFSSPWLFILGELFAEFALHLFDALNLTEWDFAELFFSSLGAIRARFLILVVVVVFAV